MVMPQGLQCWDGAGRISVNLSDYAIRYIGSTTVTFAAGETAKDVSFSGITQDGSFISIVTTDVTANEYYCRAFNGGFTAFYLPITGSPAFTFTVEVYNFQ
ncbi:hypothetical protein [Enterobacter bugandensis]|uniref:hypothetical protein n=1 Tax=Enterobacter bugandensis TaxID=881260 RepID=UPI0024470BBC|nr:hypothetical protein [Enterobacter bugandensis]MDH0087741.1 hypothetical protein [Enterobacter bugandensis]MDH0108822.1 hypothetical protein [Enterobacter bugandensis]MDH0129591.1 hypothetical protein [Enterobacter bugandensis]